MNQQTSVTTVFGQTLNAELLQQIDLVDRLAGESIGHSRFFSGIDEVREHLDESVPVFVVPFGRETFTACLHLRPSDVNAGRLAVIRFDDEGQMIEIANSVDQFVYRALLEEEGSGNEDGKMLRSFPESVAKANNVFGEKFYEQGRHGNFTRDDVEEVMISKFGGSAYSFYSKAIFQDTPQEKLVTFEQGIGVEPGSMVVHAGAAKALVEMNNRRKAAERFARSLDCYHHTAYSTDLDEYFDLGRSLMKENPDPFSQDARWMLQEPDPRNWVRKAGELFHAGDVERADKILNDMCYRIRDYTGALGAFRKHYEKLGWDWALALIDLREKP